MAKWNPKNGQKKFAKIVLLTRYFRDFNYSGGLRCFSKLAYIACAFIRGMIVRLFVFGGLLMGDFGFSCYTSDFTSY
jgi:hypothetical protein